MNKRDLFCGSAFIVTVQHIYVEMHVALCCECELRTANKQRQWMMLLIQFHKPFISNRMRFYISNFESHRKK